VTTPDAALPPLGRSTALRVAALVAFVLLGALGFLPLFGGPGYEAALAAGVVLPSTAAIAAALEIAARRPEPFDAFGRGAAMGFALALIGYAVTLLHGLRVGFCDLPGGSELFALGPAVGAVMGGAWGGVVGLVAARVKRRRRRIAAAIALALAGPVCGVLVSGWRFVSSPMVYAFDPFFGYFSGPLYDTVIDAAWNLFTYRIGSLCTLAAAAVLMAHLGRDAAGRIQPRSLGRPGLVLVGLLAAAGSLAVTAAGPELGHWNTTESITKTLGRSLDIQRCHVVYSKNILDRDARLVGRQCDAHVRQIERYLGTHGPKRITVFLFESAAQKGELMGASDTYIAKPWRKEVYVQAAPYPHPVLGHELAHVIAGSFAPAPFHVAGPLDGLLPDPGRIEGIAVASAPPEDADLTLEQWARAMQELKLLPPLSHVFRLGFLGENASTAYTVAGAFVSWFHDRFGAPALRRWYGGAPLVAVTGRELGGLEAEWHKSLQKVKVSPEAMIAAKARFDRPAIFGRRCPHVVDRLAQQAGGALGSNDYRSARKDYRELLELDPDNFGAHMGLAKCDLRAGDTAAGRKRYQAISTDAHTAKLHQLAGVEAIGDLDLRQGRVDKAHQRYDEVARGVLDEDHLRSLEVKRTPPNALARRAIVALLVGPPRLGTDWGVAAALLGRWSAADPHDGTADYLLGRNFYTQGRWSVGAAHLDEALRRTIPDPLVRREALRMRLVVACARGHLHVAERAYRKWLAEPGVSVARRQGTERMATRCGLPTRHGS
jgi:tetratricopeptide (TPR) repeat protein